MRSVRSCRRVASPLAAVLVASLAMVTAPLSTGSASAAPAGTLSELKLTSSGLAVTSSTHHKLVVTIGAQVATGVDMATVTISLPNPVEAHTWTFKLAAGLFKQTASGVTLTLHNAQLEPYGLLKLIGTNTGKAVTTTCGDGSYGVVQPVSLKGRLFFNTKSTGRQRWGGVGNKNKNLTFKAGSVVTTEYGSGGNCDDYAAACTTGPELTVFGTTAIISLQTNGKKTRMDELRFVSLSKPKGATRTDGVGATANEPKIVYSTSGNLMSASLSVTTPKTSRAHGGFEMTSDGNPTTTTDYCHRGNVDTQESAKMWSAGFENTGKIAFPEQIFGTLTVKHTLPGGSSFSIVSPDPQA